MLYWFAILQIIGLSIFEAGHRYATAVRGYNAFGGELVFLFLPFFVYLIKNVFWDPELIRILKEDKDKENEEKEKQKNA